MVEHSELSVVRRERVSVPGDSVEPDFRLERNMVAEKESDPECLHRYADQRDGIVSESDCHAGVQAKLDWPILALE
jgi:hypothetical protein